MMMKGRRIGLTRRGSVLVAVLAVGLLIVAPAALAAGEGVAGSVVNGTTGEPVPDAEVTLRPFADQAELPSVTTTTGRSGGFAFADLDPTATAYVLSTVYAGVVYQSPVAPVSPGQPTRATLEVFETTSDPGDVRQTGWVVWVDLEGEGAAVQHDLEWSNVGEAAYLGSSTLPDGTPVVVQVPLATGATNFQFLGTFLETPGQVNAATFVHPQPIVPGTTQATIRYSVPSLAHLSLPVQMPTDSIQLYVSGEIEASVTGLTLQGQTTDRGITYRVYAGTNLGVGDTIDVALSAAPGAEGGGDATLALLIAGAAALLALGGLVLWRVLRRPRAAATSGRPARRAPSKRQPSATRKPPERDTLRRKVAAASPSATGPNGGEPSRRDPDDEINLLIDEIAALDLAYERGLMERRVYEGLREATKERLLQSHGVRAGGGPPDKTGR